jgi:hypothetical protein
LIWNQQRLSCVYDIVPGGVKIGKTFLTKEAKNTNLPSKINWKRCRNVIFDALSACGISYNM